MSQRVVGLNRVLLGYLVFVLRIRFSVQAVIRNHLVDEIVKLALDALSLAVCSLALAFARLALILLASTATEGGRGVLHLHQTVVSLFTEK